MWIIVTTKSIHHDGDQRSRDFPGHGYPAYSEEVQEVKTYDDEAKLKDAILVLDRRNEHFKLYKAEELKVVKNVSFELNG